MIGSSLSTTQLFVAAPGATDGTPIDPSIFFTLPSAFTIDTIDIYGGDIPANGIPGAITEVTVGLLDTNFMLQTETFSTTPFGTVMSSLGVPVNDRIALAGSTLDGVGAFAVFLSDFVTPGTEGDWFSITEVEIFGEPAVVVPVPAAIWLFGSGLIGLIGISRSKEAV